MLECRTFHEMKGYMGGTHPGSDLVEVPNKTKRLIVKYFYMSMKGAI